MLRIKQSCFFKIGILIVAFLSSSPSLALPISPGDRLEVSIPNDKYFVGVYEVNQDGNIEIPYVGALSVVGLEPPDIQTQLSRTLIDGGFFLPEKLQLSIQILKWAPIQVTVAGETFQPGRVLINEPENPTNTAVSPESRQVTGNYPIGRYLTNAIRAAGGVLPDADISQVLLIRGDRETIVDLSGVFTGDPVEDVPLVAGDRIVVPSAGRFQPELARPSQITPPGIKVFVSNLTIPATNNASAAISNREEGISFPYGSRFSHAVVATNCAGGTEANENREAILVRADRITGATIVIESDIEDLMRNSSNNEENPLLMPKDSVACYDSTVTNIREVFRTIGDILSPLNPLLLFRNLFN
jgi:polysaccharide biosynthesis/export protein